MGAAVIVFGSFSGFGVGHGVGNGVGVGVGRHLRLQQQQCRRRLEQRWLQPCLRETSADVETSST